MFGDDFGGGFGGFFGGMANTYDSGGPGLGGFFNNSTAVPPVQAPQSPVMAPGIGSVAQPVTTNTINQQAASSLGFGGDSQQMQLAVSADQKGMGLLPMFSQASGQNSTASTPLPQARPASADAVPAPTPVASAPLPPATKTAADGSQWGDYSTPAWPANGKGTDLSASYAQPGTFANRYDAMAGNVQSPATAMAPPAAQPAVASAAPDQPPAPMPKPQASAVDNLLPTPLWQQQQPGIGKQAAAQPQQQQPSLLERVGDKIAGWLGPSSAQASEAPNVDGMIDAEAKRAGLDPNTVRSFVNIESGGNPNASTGSYKGLLQLSNSEFKENGGQGNIMDPQENLRAGVNNLKGMSDRFQEQFGRPPTAGELYLMHQQGEAGARAHLANPDAPAWQNMFSTGEGQQKGAAWAKKAIWGNIPDSAKKQFGSVENVTSRDFMNLWNARVNRGAGGQTMMASNAAPAQAKPTQVASASTPQTGPKAAKAWQPPDLGLPKIAAAPATPQSQPGIGHRINPGFAIAQTFAKAAQSVPKAPPIPKAQIAQAPKYDAAHDPVLQALNAQGQRYLPMPVAS